MTEDPKTADQPAREFVVDPRMVTFHDPHGYHAEQYRSFRTNLRAMNPTQESRSLLFTSAAPDEGKSVTTANVAMSLAESGNLEVLIVDSDLRNPRQHSLLGLDRGPGLSDILLDGKSPADVIQATVSDHLSLLPAGKEVESPGEAMGSDYMGNLIAWFKRRYQYILFDTPPCLTFAEAPDLSRLMDGCILVVALEGTTRIEADQALEVIATAGGNVVGSFVTGSDSHEALGHHDDEDGEGGAS